MPTLSQIQIKQFMLLAGQDVPSKPCVPSDEVRLLRARLILEEALETIERGLGVAVYYDDLEGMIGGFDGFKFKIERPADIVELVDGCCDVEVVTKGTLIAFGVDDEQPQQMVNENNLAKFGPGGYKHPDTGKWIKPPGHQPPDLAAALRLQGCPDELLETVGEAK